MARLIQKSGYIKNGKVSGYMEYVATRDGVEIIQSTEPVTRKQERFIKRLLKDFPDAKELFEYSDYMQTPNRGTASAFIATVLDTHLHEVESESGYMSYIAQRPRAEKHGGHGLFSEADVTDLKAAKAELEAHNGKVWTFIFSLRREDAERLGYNKAAVWRNLLKQESAAIAEAMRIRTDDFRWYAAYHDEGHHPHVHMMVWSTEPKKGYLTREGIAAMRSRVTNAIFHEEIKELYITEALCAYFHTKDKEILRKALTYFGVVLLFALGAGIGSIATVHWGVGTIWLSCGLLTVSFLIMFIHDEEQKLGE